MSVELDIRIDSDDPPALGETLEGVVDVTADEATDLEAISIECNWQVVGDGPSNTGHARSQRLEATSLEAGESDRYAFSLALPYRAPFSYEGEEFEIVWHLEASTDAPFGTGPSTRRTVDVRPPTETDREPPVSPVELESSFGQTTNSESGCASAWLGAGFLAVASAVFYSYSDPLLAEPISENLVGWSMFAGLTLGGFFILFTGTRQFLAGSFFSSASVTVEPRQLGRGDAIECELTFDGSRKDKLQALAFDLQRSEYHRELRNQSGPRESTHHETVASRRPSDFDPDTEPRKYETYTVTFEIPADVEPTFRTAHHEMTWTVSVRMVASDWPDWYRVVPLVVT